MVVKSSVVAAWSSRDASISVIVDLEIVFPGVNPCGLSVYLVSVFNTNESVHAHLLLSGDGMEHPHAQQEEYYLRRRQS